MPARPTIAVDATPLSGRVTGAGRVLKNLVGALPRADPTARYVALASEAGAAVLAEEPSEAEVVVVPPSRALAWELREVGRVARELEADLLFTIREVTPLDGPPTVMHVFEPPAYRLRPRVPARVGEAKRLAKDLLLHVLLAGSVRRAALVTAGSRATADWLRHRYRIEAPVVLPALEASFHAEDGPAADGAPYFFLLATDDPRECTDLVLEGIARARLDGVRLRVAGTPGRLKLRLLARARELGIEGAVELLGWVSDDELRALYRGALAFLHPTRYEAYAGLPALEAMALGTPVVALRAPGATEALAGAAVLLESPDAEGLAGALRRLTHDGELRSELGSRGRERVRGLTPDATASAFAEAFRAALRR